MSRTLALASIAVHNVTLRTGLFRLLALALTGGVAVVFVGAAAHLLTFLTDTLVSAELVAGGAVTIQTYRTLGNLWLIIIV